MTILFSLHACIKTKQDCEVIHNLFINVWSTGTATSTQFVVSYPYFRQHVAQKKIWVMIFFLINLFFFFLLLLFSNVLCAMCYVCPVSPSSRHLDDNKT